MSDRKLTQRFLYVHQSTARSGTVWWKSTQNRDEGWKGQRVYAKQHADTQLLFHIRLDRLKLPRDPQKVDDHLKLPRDPQKVDDHLKLPRDPQKVGDHLKLPRDPQKVGDHLKLPRDPQKVDDHLKLPRDP